MMSSIKGLCLCPSVPNMKEVHGAYNAGKLEYLCAASSANHDSRKSEKEYKI